MREDDVDDVISMALRRSKGAADAVEPCPDENALAGFAEGGLLAEERQVVERHLAACDACLDVVGALSRELRVEARPAAPRRTSFALPLAAAILVAACGLGAWYLLRGGGSTAEALMASAHDLAERDPARFGDFRPLSSEELAQRGDVRVRGGTRLVAPAGVTLETRPTLEWRTSRGDGARAVEVLDASGAVVLETRCETPCAWPSQAAPLDPGGHYTFRLVIEGPFGAEITSQPFEVASAATRDEYLAAAAAIEHEAPRRLRDLLSAHLALRGDLRAEAVRCAQRYVDAEPSDALGRETLAHARSLQGFDD